MIGVWTLSLINAQVFTYPTNVKLLPTLFTFDTLSTFSFKCESTMLSLKWKLFLLPQTLVPHETFLTHHPCDFIDTLQWNVSYSPSLWRCWLSIQVSSSHFRTKGSWYHMLGESFTREHWTLWDFFSRAAPLWETHHIFTLNLKVISGWIPCHIPN